MKIPSAARYDYVLKKVNEFILSEDINSFPIDPIAIINNHKWGIITYQELSDIHGYSVETICKAYKTKDSYSIYDGIYTIAYNKAMGNGRIRFTLMHEIGHIILNHFIDFDETILNRGGLTKEKYRVLEKEANCFARNVLSPIIILNELKLNEFNLTDIFGITNTASFTRLLFKNSDMYWITKDDYNLLFKHFSQYINIAKYSYYCVACQSNFVTQKANYCPICGSHNIKKIKLNIRGDFKMIYNDGFKLDENGRAKVCPKCNNEQISKDGDHCKICGTYLINKCSQDEGYNNGYGEWVEPCGKIADGNARYCIYCGSETTFHSQGLLKDWDKAKVEIEQAEQEAASTKPDDPDYIPF